MFCNPYDEIRFERWILADRLGVFSSDPMRVLGLDHGTARMGVALSDELRMIAQPLEFIPAEPRPAFLERLRAIIREKDVDLIVIGMPRNMNGTYGPAAEKVRAFVESVRPEIDVPIRFWDERLTSTQANRLLTEAGVKGKNRREKVDMMAAAILLQSFLDFGEAE